jgi:hypothetical protein
MNVLDPVVPPRERGPSDRHFGLTIAAVLALLACWPLVRHAPVRVWLLGVGGVLSAISVAAPRFLGAPNRLWSALARVLQRVTGPVVLTIAYVLVMTPTAWLMRLRRIDPLRRRRDPAAPTYWIERRSSVVDRASLHRPY